MAVDLKKLAYEDFAVLYANGMITDAEVEKAIEVCGSDYDFNFWALTVGDLGKIMQNEYPDRIMEKLNVEGISTYDFLRFNNAFKKFAEHFAEILSKLAVPESPQEASASVGIPKFPNHEGYLIFCKDYFTLHNFTEAENITLGDLYLAKKDAFAKKTFERNLQQTLSKK